MKKAYEVYVDDGRECFKIDVPAESKRAAIKLCEGSGEIIKCRLSESRNAKNPISADYIIDALRAANFGQMEIDLITRALYDCEFIA